MQFQSDISNVSVLRAEETEATALGAAYLAGLFVGLWNSREELKAMRGTDTVFTPGMDSETRTTLLEGWHRAVGRTLEWEMKGKE